MTLSVSSVSTTSSPLPRRRSFTPDHDTKTRLGFIADSPDALINGPRRVKNHMKSDIFGLNSAPVARLRDTPTSIVNSSPRKLSDDLSSNESNSGGSQPSTPVQNWPSDASIASGSNGHINGNGNGPVIGSSRGSSTTSSPLVGRRSSFNPPSDTKTRLGFMADQPDHMLITQNLTPRRIKNHMKSDIFGVGGGPGDLNEWKLNVVSKK